MKILEDKDIFKVPEHKRPEKFKERPTVNIIIENDKGEIALVTNPVHNLFLLPGGGAESDNLEKEAMREALEETGYHVKIVREVAQTEEYRNRNAKHYLTTCFFAKTIEKGKEDLRTKEEVENGLNTKWFTRTAAKELFSKQMGKVKRGEVSFYNTAFNIVRGNYFLESLSSTQ